MCLLLQPCQLLSKLTHLPSKHRCIFPLLDWPTCGGIRLHPNQWQPKNNNVWSRSVNCLQASAQHIWIIHSPLQKSCQGYLSHCPTSPPAQQHSNACPILTSFVLPTGLWFSTRPSKSNYTGVREVDFPIIDSMLRMRADDNTHITPTLPPLFLLSHLFCLHFTVSLLLFLSLFLSNSLSPQKRLSFFPLSFSLDLSLFHCPLF